MLGGSMNKCRPISRAPCTARLALPHSAAGATPASTAHHAPTCRVALRAGRGDARQCPGRDWRHGCRTLDFHLPGRLRRSDGPRRGKGGDLIGPTGWGLGTTSPHARGALATEANGRGCCPRRASPGAQEQQWPRAFNSTASAELEDLWPAACVAPSPPITINATALVNRRGKGCISLPVPARRPGPIEARGYSHLPHPDIKCSVGISCGNTADWDPLLPIGRGRCLYKEIEPRWMQ